MPNCYAIAIHGEPPRVGPLLRVLHETDAGQVYIAIEDWGRIQDPDRAIVLRELFNTSFTYRPANLHLHKSRLLCYGEDVGLDTLKELQDLWLSNRKEWERIQKDWVQRASVLNEERASNLRNQNQVLVSAVPNHLKGPSYRRSEADANHDA